MAASRTKPSLPVVILGIFAVGWALAGVLVYRWINRIRDADRAQQYRLLQVTMRNFQWDFVGRMFEIRMTFRPALRDKTAQRLDPYLATFYSQWRATDANAPLIEGLSVATVGADGNPQFARFDPNRGKFQAQPWPASLDVFRKQLKEASDVKHLASPTFISFGSPFALDGNRPVVVTPLVESLELGPKLDRSPSEEEPGNTLFLEGSGNRAKRASPARALQFHLFEYTHTSEKPHLPIRLTGWCFLELDMNYLAKEFLPSLVERTFGGKEASDYRVAVLTGNPPQMIYGSDPKATWQSMRSPDAALALFTPYEEGREFFVWRSGHPQGAVIRGQPAPVPPRQPRDPLKILQRDPGAWVLAAQNKAGSIEALLDRSRRRNLAMGFGALLLLACSMCSLVITTRRSRELARREMEFVAGVSHELRTPLASIHSAGFNLASGIVQNPSRIEQYGLLVQNEARRLSDMVEQVLSYAGIQSARENRRAVPTEVSQAIARALDEYLPVFHQKGWVVERQLSENLPRVLSEPASLESAIKNLLANALKYAAEGKWIGVRAQTVPNGKNPEIQISVEDHGPGIDSGDLPHIFEPFYRGKKVLASSVPGTGLGLSILKRHVEAHGGRVTVESAKGRGAKFILHLAIVSDAHGETT